MEKGIKRIISLLLVGLLVSNWLKINVSANEVVMSEEAASTEEKVYSEATIEDDFADNRVLVVLNNEASLAVDQYSTTEFCGISCNKIQSLSDAKEAVVQEKISDISAEFEAVTTNAITDEAITEIIATDEELSNYNQVLCIELEESGKEKVLDAISVLEKQEDVLYAGPDYMLIASSTIPNDTYYTNGNQWAIDKINLPKAWDITTGSSSVIVAVIDSGIDGDHPDLSTRIKTGWCRDFTSGSAVATGIPTDDNGHGTKVAGVIAGVGNNGSGICGVCWDVRLVSLKIIDANGEGYSSYAAAAIDYAEQNNIPIINMSVNWKDSWIIDYYDYALETVISNYSGLFVNSAGNQGRDNGMYPIYPADFNLSNMIVVAASDENDQKRGDSNYGHTNVHLFAPGNNIYTTSATGGYTIASGTSFAAPYVAGVAALLLAKYPNLSTVELRRTILENVDIIYDDEWNEILGDYCTTGGRLNAYRALTNVIHSFRYVNRGVSVGHDRTCSECGDTYSENHTWTEMLSGYQCSKCLVRTSYIPVTPVSLNNETSEDCCE